MDARTQYSTCLEVRFLSVDQRDHDLAVAPSNDRTDSTFHRLPNITQPPDYRLAAIGHRWPFLGDDRVECSRTCLRSMARGPSGSASAMITASPQPRGLHAHRRPRAVEDRPNVGGQKAGEKRIGHGDRRQRRRQHRLEGWTAAAMGRDRNAGKDQR